MAKAKRQAGKNPWIAAILNFFITGLGYIYVRKRRNFGYLLLIAWVLSIVDSTMNVTAVASVGSITLVSGFLIAIAFAYDAYRLAQGKE